MQKVSEIMHWNFRGPHPARERTTYRAEAVFLSSSLTLLNQYLGLLNRSVLQVHEKEIISRRCVYAHAQSLFELVFNGWSQQGSSVLPWV